MTISDNIFVLVIFSLFFRIKFRGTDTDIKAKSQEVWWLGRVNLSTIELSISVQSTAHAMLRPYRICNLTPTGPIYLEVGNTVIILGYVSKSAPTRVNDSDIALFKAIFMIF